MPSHRSQRSASTEPWEGNIHDLPCIGNGASGLVFAIDEKRVAKISLGTSRSLEDIDTERRAYQRFYRLRRKFGKREAQYILTCLEIDNARGLVFERCSGTLRDRLQNSTTSTEQRLKWALQAAEGLRFAHECQVIQGDVGCHNMLLDFNDDLKIADFAGSSICGSSATVNYEVWSRLPFTPIPTKKSDLFAFGSALYEIATGRVPYEGFSYRTIQNLYKRKDFVKDVEYIAHFGKIIKKCWYQKYHDFWDVVADLHDVQAKHSLSNLQSESQQIQTTIRACHSPSRPVSDYTSAESSSEGSERSYVHYHRRHTHHRGVTEGEIVRKVKNETCQQDERSWALIGKIQRMAIWPWPVGGSE